MAKLEMDVINTHCAGIDIGSRSHFVAAGQGADDVKEFGVYAERFSKHLRASKKTQYSGSCHGKHRHLLAKSLCRTC